MVQKKHTGPYYRLPRPHYYYGRCDSGVAPISHVCVPAPAMRAFAALSVMVTNVAGHGMLVYPPSRNAVDRFLPEFQGGKSPISGGSCNCGDGNGCDAGVRASGGGQ